MTINLHVSIRVTDVNDNAPNFVSGPYMLNVSELSLVGSVLHSEILALDLDQPGVVINTSIS